MEERALLLDVLRWEICGQTADESWKPRSLSPELLKALYTLSMRQDLAHIPGQALGRMGLLGEDEYAQKLKGMAMQAVRRYVQLSYEYGRICKTLEDARIPFIPLKGTVLRSYYPEPWMRTSCDIDILVKEDILDVAVLALREALSCQGGGKGDHDVLLTLPSGVNLELHFDTVQERFADKNSRDVLQRVWEDAQSTAPGSCHMQMSDAMFYYYHMAHMAKHFQVGGCGIRPFLDIWIMNHKMEFDPAARESLLREGGLLKFAQACQKLSEAWFSGAQMDEMTAQLQDYIFRAGLYGGAENRAALGQAKMGGKLRYVLLSRVFMPYDYLKAEYPVLEKKKWLTPVYQVKRWHRVLKTKDTKRRLAELKTNAEVSGRDTQNAAKLLRYLGL